MYLMLILRLSNCCTKTQLYFESIVTVVSIIIKFITVVIVIVVFIVIFIVIVNVSCLGSSATRVTF